MPIFDGLGRSLRWLRERQVKRQYQVAAGAGITKAMLSAYETGKQNPSLDTLEKILDAAERYEVSPAGADMEAMVSRTAMSPLFT